MVVVAFNGGRLLLEAYVVEARKGRPVDILDRVVRNEEVFFPPHEDIFRRLEVRIIEVVAVERLGVVLKRPEFAPVFPVNFLVGIPFPREKRVLPADDLSVEERCERRVLLRKALDLQVAAEVRVGLVHMLASRGSETAAVLLRAILVNIDIWVTGSLPPNLSKRQLETTAPYQDWQSRWDELNLRRVALTTAFTL